MIGWGDVYKVVAAMAPLYFALVLGYGSVRWWRLFTPDQCDTVNRLVAYFAVPFFGFDFASRVDPFALSYRITIVHGRFQTNDEFLRNLQWHVQTPSIIEGSVLIMSKTGVGLSMFSMGLFMALQEKIIVCGAGPTVLGMALRFVAGPSATAVGAFALGLRGDLLRLAIIQGYIRDIGVITSADRVLHCSRLHTIGGH
uniref:Auxin efflux carrier component n=1 Tax=Oryza brachyantha TaxID=4533 RepID=J3MYZ4_ORYBR